MQSRKHSATEPAADLVRSYFGAVILQFAILPLFGIVLPTESCFWVGGWFLIIAIWRYGMVLFRRWEGRR